MTAMKVLRALPGRADLRARVHRSLATSEDIPLVVLSLLSLLLTATGFLWPAWTTPTVLLLPIFVGSLWLGPRTLPWFTIFCLACAALLVLVQPTIDVRSLIRVLLTFIIGFLVLLTSFRRRRLGVSGPRSESMFVDLRDRISNQGRMPDLPDDWYADAVIRSEGGTAFAGDFMVASLDPGGRELDVVLVDVSGKGVQAGTRALLLSGAFGGLLAAMAPSDFLGAANAYLLRQQWPEGFATAVHLHVDLWTGYFALRKAGHPPGVLLEAGSGEWRVLDSDGPALGLLPDPEIDCVQGRMDRGDALLLYTDGVVETPTKDFTSGIDKLAGRAARMFQRGFAGGAAAILDSLDVTADDRGLIVLHRR